MDCPADWRVHEEFQFFAEARDQRLRLIARQLGYLAAPIGEGRESRSDTHQQNNLPLPLPEIEAGRLLFEDWKAVGFCAEGPSPISHLELSAFAAMHRLTKDDAVMLRAMSEEYCEGYRHGTNPFAIPPWEDD